MTAHIKLLEEIADEIKTACFDACAAIADRYASRERTDATAATTAATAEMTQSTVEIIKRFLSVLSREAGVSTNWFGGWSKPGT